MNIHLVNDEKFINQSVIDFENYCPNQNLFVIDKKLNSSLKYVTLSQTVITLDLTDKKALTVINSYCQDGITNIFVHCLSPVKAHTSLELKSKYNARVHWICYGADLYGYLFINGKYKLFDDYNSLRQIYSGVSYMYKQIRDSIHLQRNLFSIYGEFFKAFDFFDSWNHYDFQLFKSHYQSSASLKSFRYSILRENDFIEDFTSENKSAIMINQSASNSGNHLTILKKIAKIDYNSEIRKLIVPLSYGNKKTQKKICIYGESQLNYCFSPLLKFFAKREYLLMLSEIKCSVFGHRRQEAASNIFILLSFGAKVFLRKDNNLLQYFNEKGYVIYEFETDLVSLNDLSTLTIEQQKLNRELVNVEFSENNLKIEFENLFK